MVDDSMKSRGTTAPVLSAARRNVAATAVPCQSRTVGAQVAEWFRVSPLNSPILQMILGEHSAETFFSISRNSLFRRFLAALAGQLSLSTILRTRTFGVCGSQHGRWLPVGGLQRLPVVVCSSGSLRLVEVSVRQ